jgi:uncharacterized RDD family membrane protein YckC
MGRIDVNKLLSRVDWNMVLDRVNVDEQLGRIDMDRLMDRVDVNRIVERSNLEEIVSRASTGVCSECIDLLRTRLAWFDQWGQRLCQLRWLSKDPLLPPRPGRVEDSKAVWPVTTGLRAREFGQAVQFRTCGGLCRLATWTCDTFIIVGTFAAWSAIGKWLARAVTNDPTWFLDPTLDWLTALLYGLYSLLYTVLFLGGFGRTIPMYLFGLLLVSSDGHKVSFLQSLLHGILLPVNIPLFGWVLTFLRRDGKMWNDLCARTAMVYAWEVHTSPKQYADLVMSVNEYYEGADETRNRHHRRNKNRKTVKRRTLTTSSSSVQQRTKQLKPSGSDDDDDVDYYDTEQPSPQPHLVP